jgi:phosphatidylglycerophosphatase GEP4
VVIGDRISTDVLMANLMGARSIWIRDGVDGGGTLAGWEKKIVGFLQKRGMSAPKPRSQFEGE